MGKIKQTPEDDELHPHEILRQNLNKYTNKIITKDGNVKKKIAKQFTAYKCDICKKKFEDKWNLASHMKIHSDECYACPQCPYVGKTKKYLSRHLSKVHTPPTAHKCGVCGKMFHYMCKLKEHAMVHTGEKPHKCNVCGKTFRVTFSLNSHMLIHRNEKPFKCSFCAYACRDISTLRKHENRHMGFVKSFPCKLCPKKFPEKAKLKYHISEVHLEYLELDLRRHRCHICSSSFRKKHNLNKHIKSVHERLFECNCPVCGVRVSDKHNLPAHLRTHFEDRPYRCTHEPCTKRFKDKSTLKKHTIIHQPHLQHACRVCGAMFTRRHRLRSHMLTHGPRDKWAQCDYCEVKFYSKNYLIKHIRMKHSKKRQKYICDLCRLVTYNKPSIVMHLKYGHQNDNDLHCKICKKKYKLHAYLKSHYLKTHKIRYKPMKRKKREVSKPPIDIKVEPEELECEEIQAIQILKQEILDDEDPNLENDLVSYSKNVLSEDLAECLLNDDIDIPENNFDEFLFSHVFQKRVKDDVPEPNEDEVDESELTSVTEKVKDIIKKSEEIKQTEIIELKKRNKAKLLERKLKGEAKVLRRKRRQEVYELEKVRQMYNERMKAAAMEANEKEPAKTIKYFQRKTTEKTDKKNPKEETENDPNTTNNNTTSTSDIQDNVTHSSGNVIEQLHKINDLNEMDNKSSNKDDKIDDSNKINNVSLSNSNTVNEIKDKSLNNIDKVYNLNELNAKSSNNVAEVPLREDCNLINDEINIHSNDEMIKLSLDNVLTHEHINNDDCTSDEPHMDKTEDTNCKNDAITEKSCIESLGDSVNDTTTTENSKINLQNDNINKNNLTNDKNRSENGGIGDTTNDANTNENDSAIHVNTNETDKTDAEMNVNDKNDKGDHANNDKSDDDSDYVPSAEDGSAGVKRLTFKTHQCYICFKLYPTKEELINHCQSHFDICNSTTLSKCPVCAHVASANIKKHMVKKHGIHIKIPYNRITDRKDNSEGSRYCYQVDNKGTMMEIIPSVRILNHNAAIEIDKKNRERRDNTVAKTRLVKKGKEWIVENVAVDLSYDELPEFTKKELSSLNVSESYTERLGQLSRVAHKRGYTMLFPCDKCRKICQTFSALKLHSRRHDPNKKPFARRVNRSKNKQTDTQTKPAPVKKKPKVNLDNRVAKPKPIVNNHKCDENLKRFYESHIRGADIEFWQFLKIFNKMDRDNIQDFKDFEGTTAFGIHTNEERTCNDPKPDEINEKSDEHSSKTAQDSELDVKNDDSDEDDSNNIKRTSKIVSKRVQHDEFREHIETNRKTKSKNAQQFNLGININDIAEVDSKNAQKSRKTTSKMVQQKRNFNMKSKKISKEKHTSYKKVVMISKKQHLEREKAKRKLRQKIEEENV